MSDDPILKALAHCNPNLPLEPGDPRFVDFDDIRGTALRTNLLKRLGAAENGGRYAKVAVAGHRGGGKSTELNRAQAELADKGYEVLWASVNDNLDPSDISFSDVMRLILLLLDDRFGHETAKYPGVKLAFDTALAWFQDVTKTHSREIQDAKEFGLKLGAGGKAGVEGSADGSAGVAKAGLKFRTDLGELAAAINVVRRSEGKERTEIKETLERYNSQLVENVNALLRSLGIAHGPGLKLVFILDNVDKYEAEVVNSALLRQAGLFQDLDAHLVFTIQSSLLHNPVEDAVEESFQTLPIPMLPVFQHRSRTPNPPVLERLRKAVYLRVPAGLFAGGDSAVDELIRASGGCWRDLLRLLEEALLNADAVIGPKEIQSAQQHVAQTFQRLLRSQEDLKILAATHRTHDILGDDRSRHLLHHRCILAYNGKGWYDIHPLLDSFPPVQKAIAAESTTPQ